MIEKLLTKGVEMLTKEEYLTARELHGQGCSISAIARHLGRDRKTVRSYLGGTRVAGVRSPALDASLHFLPYCRRRLADDPHLLATHLFAEVVELGYPGGYSTFTRALRRHQLRPSCPLCRPGARHDGTAGPQQPGREVRFRWLELPDPSVDWGCGDRVHLLTGTLTASGRWRGVLTDGNDFPHLVEAVDQVLRRLDGTPPQWRLDGMPTACAAPTGRLTTAFAQVARYYGVSVVFTAAEAAAATDERVGEAHDVALREWWHVRAHTVGLTGAQEDLDRFAAGTDSRHSMTDGTDSAVDTRGTAREEGDLLDLPAASFPARVCAQRVVGSQGLVPFHGGFYAVQPDLSGALVEVRRRLDEPYLSITTLNGAVIARHLLAPPGSARTLADDVGATALERPPRVPRAQTSACQDSRSRRPLSWQALAEADVLRGRPAVVPTTAPICGRSGSSTPLRRSGDSNGPDPTTAHTHVRARGPARQNHREC
jgi:hypothetical protein